MMMIRHALVLAWKDLLVESRSRQTIGLVMLMGVLVVVVLALGLGPGQGAGPSTGLGAASILWVAYLFGGTLCFERTMGLERDDDVLSALMLAPIDRASIFLGKLLANLALLFGLVIVVTPVAVVLFRFDLSRAPGAFAGVVALSMVGLAAVGTLFSALTSGSRARGGLLALVIFPLNLPLVLASTRLLSTLGEADVTVGIGLPIIVAFDVLFLVAGWLTFELVLEP